MFVLPGCLGQPSFTNSKIQMKTKYIDLIEQTYDFPQEEFKVNKANTLEFQGIDLMNLIQTYGAPLKFT